jgi:hypothetical protein
MGCKYDGKGSALGLPLSDVISLRLTDSSSVLANHYRVYNEGHE